MRKNQKGSMLVWAVIIILVLLIIVGVGLSISFSYFNRSLQYKEQQQAYYTAQSGMEAVISAIGNETEENKKKLIPAAVDDAAKEITKIAFASQNDDSILGTAKAVIQRVDTKKLKITVTATKGKQTYTLYADVAYSRVDNAYRWIALQMYDDEHIILDTTESEGDKK